MAGEVGASWSEEYVCVLGGGEEGNYLSKNLNQGYWSGIYPDFFMF